MRKLAQFNGGVHPPQHKNESNQQPILSLPLPERLTVPLRQHIGNPAKPLVSAGERVLKGQLIGKAEGYVSAAVHAPTSGRVIAVEPAPVPHPSGLSDLCVIIEVDGEEEWGEHAPLRYREMDPSAVRNRIRDLGVVGLGGAVFPSFIKLNPGAKQKTETLIINGAECEPYITCDDRLMRERADDIMRGIEIMGYMLHPSEVLIGIEDNKPEAIAAMQAAAAKMTFPVEVVAVPTVYPGGGARQLTRVLTGKEPPAGGRSTDIGVQIFNVATAYSLHRAVHLGEAMLSRVVTVTGNVAQPGNFEALIGTPVEHLLAAAGGAKSDTSRYIMGGPMMGIPLTSAALPVTKAMNCVIAASDALFPEPPPAMPCIRCGRCAQACPADLQPFELYWHAKSRNFGKTQEYGIFDCIECGCCDYVCPSHIPLVEYYRFAKSEIWAREQEKAAADNARNRHEFRTFRLEREKQERAERLAQKAASAKTSDAPAESSSEADAEKAAKKAAIEAALERAKAKKAQVQPQNTDNLPPEKQQEIAEIEARRAQIREMAQQPPDTTGN